MKSPFLLIGLALSSVALALEPVGPPDLLPGNVARPVLMQDPAVAAARAGLEAGRNEARILDRSPYEWTPRVTAQQRRTESSPRYNEWNAGLERTIRLPSKVTADRNLGNATLESSQARYGIAIIETAHELADQWIDWLAAEQAAGLAKENEQVMQNSLAVVENRVRAGDASRLDLSIARAELAEQKRFRNEANTQAAVTWLRASSRFPTLVKEVTLLPAPQPIGEEALQWRERILARSDHLQSAYAQMRMTRAIADRSRADRTPDPTLGIFMGSESGGRERISGITVSIPIPGQARNLRSAKAAADVEISTQELELRKRQVASGIAAAFATAQGAYESLRIARESTMAMQDNARLMQRAYTLGEADLQAMLLARRQAIAAANSALQAQVTALKAYYGLLVDAHLIWGLENELD